MKGISEERRGELALLVLRNMKRKEGMSFNPNNVKRGLGNLSKEINVPIEELIEFYRSEAQRLLDECISNLSHE